MTMTITDEEANALLERTRRRMSAREVLARKQPPIWQRVMLAGATILALMAGAELGTCDGGSMRADGAADAAGA